MTDDTRDNPGGNETRLRLFLAAPVDTELAQPLLESLRASETELPPMKPTPWANLHLTMVFLGDHSRPDLEQNLIPRIDEALSQAKPGRVHFRQVAGFPSPGSPRHLVLEGHGSPSALALREGLVKALTDLLPEGQSQEHWRPHITLARLRAADAASIEATPWQVDLPLREIVLYRSERGMHGSIYTALHRWNLTDPGE